MFIVDGAHLTEFTVHLEKSAINATDRRKAKEEKSVADTVESVQYKDKESEDNQMDRHKEVEIVDNNK